MHGQLSNLAFADVQSIDTGTEYPYCSRIEVWDWDTEKVNVFGYTLSTA